MNTSKLLAFLRINFVSLFFHRKNQMIKNISLSKINENFKFVKRIKSYSQILDDRFWHFLQLDFE